MATPKNVIAAAAVVLKSHGAMEVVKEINRVNKELRNMKQDAKRASSAMGALGRASKRAGKFAGGVGRVALGNIGAGVFGGGVGGLMQSARHGGMSAIALMVKEATEAEATMIRLGAIFKDNARIAVNWASDVANSLERTTHGVANTETTFMGFFKGLEFGAETAEGFARALTKLNYDFAAFTKQTDDESMRRFIAALAGSPEVLDQWGIDIKQQSLDKKMVGMGMRTTADGASEQEKAVGRIKIILDSMSEAQLNAIGAAERMSGSLSQQYARMLAQMKELAAVAGHEFMPAFQAVVRTLKEFFIMLRKNVDWSEVLKALEERFSSLVDAVKDMRSAIGTGDWENVFKALEDGFGKVVERMANPLVDAMAKSMLELPGRLVATSESAVSGGVSGAFSAADEAHTKFWLSLFDSIEGVDSFDRAKKTGNDWRRAGVGTALDRAYVEPLAATYDAHYGSRGPSKPGSQAGMGMGWGTPIGSMKRAPGEIDADIARARELLGKLKDEAKAIAAEELQKELDAAESKAWKNIVSGEMDAAMSGDRAFNLQTAQEELRLWHLRTKAVEANTAAERRNAWEEMQAIGKSRKAKEDDIQLSKDQAEAKKKEEDRVKSLYTSEIQSALAQDRVFNVQRVVNSENMRKATMLAAGQMRRTGGIDRALWNNIVSMNNRFKPQAAMMDWHKVGATTSGRAAAMGVGANAGLLGENKKHTKLLRKIERKTGTKVAP